MPMNREAYYQDNQIALYNADCLDVLKELPNQSIDLLCTDPPYGIGFMGKDWDKALPSVDIWQECIRVLKPGAFAFVMCIPRQDCLARMIVSLQDAGFNTNFTSIYWAYSSGFPKAQNTGKAVDKRLGAEREKFLRPMAYPDSECWGTPNKSGLKAKDVETCFWTSDKEKGGLVEDSLPASPQAKVLDGSYGGFQPKPAVEVILVAMKALSEKTYVEQALKNRHGITWLDDGRIPYKSQDLEEAIIRAESFMNTAGGYQKEYVGGKNKKSISRLSSLNNQGRFPANLLCGNNILDDGRNWMGGPGFQRLSPFHFGGEYCGDNKYTSQKGLSDAGSFSRFFDLDKWWEERIKQLPKSVQKTFPFLVCAKASKSEKNRGCEGLPEKEYKQGNIIRQVAWCNKCNHLISPKHKIKGNCQCDIPELFYKQVDIQPIKNNHPTCKPLKLMSYLIILGSREGDIVLDPFVGSGTTALACKLSGRRCIGIEISEEYCEIARSRCNQQVLI